MSGSSERDRAFESIGLIFLESAQDTITAFAGGGQANATPLVKQTNRVTVVATAGDSVMLPASRYGMEVMVINASSNPLQVYGALTEKVNDVASATGISQMPGSVVIYVAATAGNWYTEGLGSGFSGSYATQSYKNAITAHAGGTQAAAIADANAQIPAMLNRITTCATGGDSVVLPLVAPGMTITITNAGAASCNVFPFTGDQINAAGANAAFALAAGKTAQFSSTVLLNWHAILSA